MRKRIGLFVLVIAFLLPALAAQAQSTPPPPAATGGPASAALQRFYNGAKRNIQRGAEKMPEADYSFRPTPEVRTFGELVAHIAEGQYLLCSSAKGEPARWPLVNWKEQTTKADIVAALQAAYEYCDPLFASLTDAQLGDKVSSSAAKTPSRSPLPWWSPTPGSTTATW
jgi:hypothetical protein